MALVLFQRTVTMLIRMGVGLLATKVGMIDEDFTKRLGRVLLTIITPCLSFHGLVSPPDGATPADLARALVLSALLIVITVVAGFAIYGRRRPIDCFAATFFNCGFIGVPLVTSVFGTEAMFYVSGLIALFNVFMFTYGIWLLTGDPRHVSLRSVATNPVVLAAVVGVVVFMLGIPMPAVLDDAVEILADCNTGLAMLILGSYLARLDLRSALGDWTVMPPVLLRLVAIPLASIGVMRLLGWEPDVLTLSVLIGAIGPVGTNTALFAEQYGTDLDRSVSVVCISTVLSVVTVPLVFQAALMVLG